MDEEDVPEGFERVTGGNRAAFYKYRGVLVIHWKNMPPDRKDRWRLGGWNGESFASARGCAERIDALMGGLTLFADLVR